MCSFGGWVSTYARWHDMAGDPVCRTVRYKPRDTPRKHLKREKAKEKAKVKSKEKNKRRG